MLINKLIDRTLNRVLPHIAMRRIFACILLGCLVFLIFSITAYAIKVEIGGLVDWRGFFTVAGKIILGYFVERGGPLGIIVMLLLAFAAFWVISDTRHFRYLDDKTKTIVDLNNWAADVIRYASIPARQVGDIKELKKNWVDCRTELVIKVAHSIGVFAAARRFSTDVRIKSGEELSEKIDKADHELRDFITMLFDINIDKATNEQIDQLMDEVQSLITKMRELLEITPQI